MSAKIKSTADFKQLSIEEAFKILETSMLGLTESEAKNRIEKFGYNEITEEKKNPLIEFFSRYWGPMPWLLELAIVLSCVLGHYVEAVIIFVLLTINVVIGFVHSSRSQRVLNFLKKRLAVKAKVLREGKWTVKDAKEIVLGDVILVGLGDLVPADAKIISGELSVDQSALTGESLPVNLRPSDIVYSSSIVTRGEAKCVVVNTGVNTYFGRTAELVKKAKPKSHQEEIMMAITKYMMYFSLAALTLTSAYALPLNIGVLSILTFAVIFLMGAIPVALPAVLTIVQAVGAMELAKEGVLVTRLDSIEDAASIDIVCLDKTGTITQNRLSVVEVIPFSSYKKEDVALIAALASEEESKDIIDLTVINYAKSLGVNLDSYKHVSFTPFNPSIKRSESVVESNRTRFKAVKGAPQIIVSLCKKADAVCEEANAMLDKLSEKGYRTLAVAKSENEDFDNLQFVGLLALADPIRPDSKAMIEEIKRLGIKPMMLTGDNISIAKEIARQASIGERIIPIAELRALNEVDKAKVVETYDGFAEVYPEDKYEIVKLLQSKGHMVGMTGDGVNDAPALKQAEMGIAVSNSTDVAKASASVVLTEQGVKVIVSAIKISRQIYQRMLTWVINKVTKVIQFVALLTIGFFWLHDIILSLLGMTLLIFANDFATMSLATDHVKYTSNPNKWNIKNITLASLVVGSLMVIGGILTIAIGKIYFNLEEEKLQTFTMLTLVFYSQFRVYIVRERRHFWSSKPGKGLTISIIATLIGFTLLGIYGLIIPSLPPYHVLVALGFSALFTVGIIDPFKYLVFKRLQL
ncbi:MAG: plasma-membrane proton-efflux P-type ATPase [Candidatus Bathyarchaeales archaeon]